MKEVIKLSVLVAILVVLSACAATGPKFSQMQSTLPELKPDVGRIFFYRVGSFGAAVQPAILLNGNEVGKSFPNGFFYVDRPPGNYEVSCSTEVTRKATFVLDAGQTRFIKTRVGFGIMVGRVYPERGEFPRGEKIMR
jgi:hypothetical protein